MTEPEPVEPVSGDGLPPRSAPAGRESGMHPARELSLHVLRMIETRMEALGIALRRETSVLMSRLQMKILAGAALFLAAWAGIILLAIALPENWRVPVLGAVVAVFVIVAVVAFARARHVVIDEVGSMAWFLDHLRADFELLTRTLARPPESPVPEGEGARTGNGSDDVSA